MNRRFDGQPDGAAWLTLEQMAAACRMKPEGLVRHIEGGGIKDSPASHRIATKLI
jgi:hypothetical protein